MTDASRSPETEYISKQFATIASNSNHTTFPSPSPTPQNAIFLTNTASGLVTTQHANSFLPDHRPRNLHPLRAITQVCLLLDPRLLLDEPHTSLYASNRVMVMSQLEPPSNSENAQTHARRIIVCFKAAAGRPDASLQSPPRRQLLYSNKRMHACMP